MCCVFLPGAPIVAAVSAAETNLGPVAGAIRNGEPVLAALQRPPERMSRGPFSEQYTVQTPGHGRSRIDREGPELERLKLGPQGGIDPVGGFLGRVLDGELRPTVRLAWGGSAHRTRLPSSGPGSVLRRPVGPDGAALPHMPPAHGGDLVHGQEFLGAGGTFGRFFLSGEPADSNRRHARGASTMGGSSGPGMRPSARRSAASMTSWKMGPAPVTPQEFTVSERTVEVPHPDAHRHLPREAEGPVVPVGLGGARSWPPPGTEIQGNLPAPKTMPAPRCPTGYR